MFFSFPFRPIDRTKRYFHNVLLSFAQLHNDGMPTSLEPSRRLTGSISVQPGSNATLGSTPNGVFALWETL